VNEMLIKKGANINAISETGQSPLSQAVLNNNVKLAELLLKHGA